MSECGVAAEGDVAVAVTDFQIEKKNVKYVRDH